MEGDYILEHIERRRTYICEAPAQRCSGLGQSKRKINKTDGLGKALLSLRSLILALAISLCTITFGESVSVLTQDLDLSTLTTAKGIRYLGAVKDEVFGQGISGLGDINGDKIGDFLMSAPFANVGSPAKNNAGRTHVIFGKNTTATPGAFANIDTLSWVTSSSTGFRIIGAAANDNSGASATAVGDVNGDLISDFAIGAPFADPPLVSPANSNAGIVYVIFGRVVTVSANNAFTDIDLFTFTSTASIGFRILGAVSGDNLGVSVSYGGDLNGDNRADIIVGIPNADVVALGGNNNAGFVCVVFGRDVPNSGNAFGDFDISTVYSTNTNGYCITGAASGDAAGKSVSYAGDFNKDGFNDVLVGAYLADPNIPSARNEAGIAYVVFGKSSPTTVSLTSMTTGQFTGFRILGAVSSDNLGYSVSFAGDINGDGTADIVVGAYEGDSPALTGDSKSGMVYVIFGKEVTSGANSFTDINLQSFTFSMSTGFRIYGVADDDNLGFSVSAAGDVSGDGVTDLIIGAPNASPATLAANSHAGIAYVIFGRKVLSVDNAFEDINLQTFTTGRTTGYRVLGTASHDQCGVAVASAGDINGDGISDVMVGATGFLRVAGQESGAGFVIFGDFYVEMPTRMPTASPSLNPSRVPSALPTRQPTQPTSQPSSQPSRQPSRQPSSQPSRQPSSQPIKTPSAQPSNQPSAQPTNQPSNQPSRQPSVKPSSQPTKQPSPQPSRQPSGQPTRLPSSQPSSQPSAQPTRKPSSQPTNQPTAHPSVQPSRQPSGQPSRQPSSQPSSQPSVQPSAQPSTQPSRRPSLQPSAQPTRQPSSQPTGQPSSQPSRQLSHFPTAQPSGQPSALPTLQPLSSPTSQPLVQPTMNPTTETAPPTIGKFPSSQPTNQPSTQPTSQPSQQPSHQPSIHLSAQPSSQPTIQPSAQPKAQPTSQPSGQPSRQPSTQPSAQPSTQPSRQPTSRPSAQPSGQPSMQPSSQPSAQPTFQPSVKPSASPTSCPSSQPSQQPTSEPSNQPSRQPSSLPTVQPSRQPSRQPSANPSRQPSLQPSTQPSRQPSSQPSRQPSTQPSVKPSAQPSSQPSRRPSSQPSAQPSRQPSSAPSSQPTDQPSRQPSRQPSTQPSAQPSRQPSRQPTRQPSTQPSAQPTSNPSINANTGNWATIVSGEDSRLNQTVQVNSDLWACGTGSGKAECAVVDALSGKDRTRYAFPWDSVTNMMVIPSSTGVYAEKLFLSGRTINSDGVTTTIFANCAVNVVPPSCVQKSFFSTTFWGSAYASLKQKVLFVGYITSYGTATIVDAALTTSARNFYYSGFGMRSMGFLRAASPANFIGSFVAGSSVSTGYVNTIVAGWVHMDSGDLSAMYLTPTSSTSNILNNAELVNAMVLEPLGPDMFIAGALQLSSSSSSAESTAYLIRANALYRRVSYGMRYRRGLAAISSGSRRLQVDSALTSSVARGMVYVDAQTLFMVTDYPCTFNTAQSCVSVLKIDASTGFITKQASITAHNASIACSDITSADDTIKIACSVQYRDTPEQSLLVSTDQELSFSRLPAGVVREENSVFSAERVAFSATRLSVTKNNLEIATEDSAAVTNFVPTQKPTAAPSNVPSSRPSSAPTSQPSTNAPSISPQPSSQPSTSGPTSTTKPIAVPTLRPTRRSSLAPSVTPSVQPSVRPSVRPTANPSFRPTLSPTGPPSVAPSQLPSVRMTRRPSASPTIEPTLPPTEPPTVFVPVLPKGESDQTMTIAGAVVGGLFFIWIGRWVLNKYLAIRKKNKRRELGMAIMAARAEEERLQRMEEREKIREEKKRQLSAIREFQYNNQHREGSNNSSVGSASLDISSLRSSDNHSQDNSFEGNNEHQFGEETSKSSDSSASSEESSATYESGNSSQEENTFEHSSTDSKSSFDTRNSDRTGSYKLNFSKQNSLKSNGSSSGFSSIISSSKQSYNNTQNIEEGKIKINLCCSSSVALSSETGDDSIA